MYSIFCNVEYLLQRCTPESLDENQIRGARGAILTDYVQGIITYTRWVHHTRVITLCIRAERKVNEASL